VTRRGRGDGGIYRDPERNRWVGQLDLGVGPDGTRLRRKVVGRTKSDVAAKLRDLRKEHDGRPGTTPGLQTVGELAARWLDTAVRARHEEGSPMWETYQYVIDHHIAPGLGHRQLRAVTPDDVDRFLIDRAKKGYSRSVVRRVRNTLSQVFRWGVRRRQCSWDPASFAELPPASVYAAATPRVNRTPRALRPDEARRFIKAATDDRNEALLLVAICTGLRPGELLALHWEDVDLEAGTLIVRRAWKGHDSYRHIGEPKTRSSIRTVALPSTVVAALGRHRQEQSMSAAAGPEEWRELVFTSAAGTPIDPSNLRRLVKDVADRAAIGHLAPYDLRHTAASLLSDAGVPNHELADLLGHTTTRRVEVHYRHRLTETIDVAVGPMDKLVDEGLGDTP
jgi:integrase